LRVTSRAPKRGAKIMIFGLRDRFEPK